MYSEIQARYSDIVDGCNLGCGSNIEYLNIKPGETILDLGCGRGVETLQAALLAGSQGNAIGLDITPSMIQAAGINADKSGITNAEFIYGDIENLPFKDGIFDAVMSNCVINHAKNKFRVYSEIRRVLKNKGRFVISDAVTKQPLPPEIKNDPEAWAQCFGGAVTEQEYFENIRKAGFNKTEVLKRREYQKNGFDFISLTIKAAK